MMRDPVAPRQIARFCRQLLKEKAATAEPDLTQQLQQWALECDSEADRRLPRSPADQLREQARRHRLRAEEYRAIAEQMQMESERGCASYRLLAESYDRMAAQLEAPALPRRGLREVN